MKHIINECNYRNKNIGTKAKNLFVMRKSKWNVPKLFCVQENSLKYDACKKEIINYLDREFHTTKMFSIRSSTSVEDGKKQSYAGQFTTYLNVKKVDVYQKIKQCLKSNQSKNINHKHGKMKITIIVQEMIEAQTSGVLFTVNPQGILNESVIVAGKGTGDQVVEDLVPTTTYYYHHDDAVYYAVEQKNAVKLKKGQIKNLMKIQKKAIDVFGKYLDIEFSIKDDEIFILQVRNITTLKLKKEIVLDNSNIVESYPGITLPLTISFVKDVYYQVFKSCLLRLTKEPKTVWKADYILRNMVEAVNGRIYYQISSWYDVLLFLPFHNRIIQIWQEMLGVENKKVTYTLDGTIKAMTRLKVTLKFLQLLKTSPNEMDALNLYFNKVLKYYKKKYRNNMTNEELIDLYQDLKKRITQKWDITLVNDMYSFLYTSFVKNTVKKEEANRLISNISNLESMKPVQSMIKIAKYCRDQGYYSEIKEIKDNEDYQEFIENHQDKKLKKLFQQYIELYGDRNMEELKLESQTFSTKPVLFLFKLKEYMEDKALDSYLELNRNPTWNDIKMPEKTRKYLKKASTGIRNRETSRLNRSRLYGIMRNIMLLVARNFKGEGIIEEEKDIFYLYYPEIEDIILGEGKLNNIKELIKERKRIYRSYEKLPGYSRLVFDGKAFDKSDMDSSINQENFYNGKLKGIPCSGGIAEGEALVVLNGQTKLDVKDKILVTKVTDPGWVFYITRAKGVVAEKGSLLSHTAIITRELQKPSVVGVKNATHNIKTGDRISINGDTGEVRIIENDYDQ